MGQTSFACVHLALRVTKAATDTYNQRERSSPVTERSNAASDKVQYLIKKMEEDFAKALQSLTFNHEGMAHGPYLVDVFRLTLF